MTRFILRWAINAIALYAALRLVPGLQAQSMSWLNIVLLALIFGLVNALIRPVLSLVTCPMIVLTLGLFTLLLNTFLFWVTGWVGERFGIGFQATGFLPLFLGALVVSLVSWILSQLLKGELHSRPASE
jgi:putative membrane protein